MYFLQNRKTTKPDISYGSFSSKIKNPNSSLQIVDFSLAVSSDKNIFQKLFLSGHISRKTLLNAIEEKLVRNVRAFFYLLQVTAISG